MRNSNGHNFSHGCPIQANHISRLSKLNNGSSGEIQMVIIFTRMSDYGASHIETLENELRKLLGNSQHHTLFRVKYQTPQYFLSQIEKGHLFRCLFIMSSFFRICILIFFFGQLCILILWVGLVMVGYWEGKDDV